MAPARFRLAATAQPMRRRPWTAPISAETLSIPGKAQKAVADYHTAEDHACACGGLCPKCRAQSAPPEWIEHVEVHADIDASGASPAPAPPVAPADAITSDPSAMAQFFCLFRAAQYGVAEYERAAWIVSSGGSISLGWWPASYSHNKETFKGVVPSGAIAFVHTHPNSASPQPSHDDKDASSNIGLPLYVISGDAIWRTDGSSDSQVADADWWRPYRKTKC